MKLMGLLAPLMGLSAMLMLAGCGHSDEEMAAKQREVDALTADLKAARQQIADDQKKYADANANSEKLRAQLKQAGIDLEQTKKAAEDLKQALAEYKQRADQLAAIEARFKDLKNRLDKLTSVGLKVVVRNNRMVIQLPGDVLFDSGKDELKQSGKDVLGQVADVIRNDSTLSTRKFEVAGHTDNQPYPQGGRFLDNWGLSVMRGRSVLVYLTSKRDEKDPKKGGGGLDPKNWGAAGFGDMDPQIGTVEKQSKEEMGKNRRVEIVLQPDVQEMLNLSNIH
jgi:chemotaxis protein MotB